MGLLQYRIPGEEIKVSSHFRNVQLPLRKDEVITWADDNLEVKGNWKATLNPIECRIFDSEKGYLDWYCFQPRSDVELRINNRNLKGNGYAEQLILTALPWHIPMNELRWGRFHSLHETMVWIELRKEDRKHWFWLNGESILDGTIEDDQVLSSKKNFLLKLDRKVVLESEKKIYKVVEKLLHYLPGIKKVMPLKFLMADNHKWLSKGEFQKNNSGIYHGLAIHERVDFNSPE